MRKIIGSVLLGLGAFMIVAALVANFWAHDAAKRTPLDVDSVTRLDGTAARIDTANGGLDEFDVRAVSVTQADSEASDDDIVVFTNYTCLVKDVPNTPDCGQRGTGDDADPNVINVSEPVVFATDRQTAQAVQDPEYLPEGAPPTEGVVNKWPFDTQQQEYEVWDSLLQESVTASFEGVEEVEGFETYRFQYEVDEQPAEVLADTDGLYSQQKTFWIEPKTGTIIDQEQEEVRALEDGTVLLELDLAFTDEQVSTNVEDTEDSVSSLNLIGSTVPTVGLAAGIPLALIGLALLLLGRRNREAQPTPEGREQSTSA